MNLGLGANALRRLGRRLVSLLALLFALDLLLSLLLLLFSLHNFESLLRQLGLLQSLTIVLFLLLLQNRELGQPSSNSSRRATEDEPWPWHARQLERS
jgi:hypothetical protein